MRIIGLIPARGGSKRLHNKNVYPLNGVPLIQYTINASLESKYLSTSNVYVSSDSSRILNLALDSGIQIIDRPTQLARDETWTQDVINHLDDFLGDLEDEDIIVVLQANSPQITSSKIDDCIELLIRHKLWQVNTIGKDCINNGAVQVFRRKVKDHKGKVNYNGVVKTDWIDVHYKEDIDRLERLL
tara:strand:- start:4159 stop:4716 length:558 start_codon:yes stop_codon:yes gene_type:complete